MPDPTNDIYDRMRQYLADNGRAAYHDALISLVAERDALRKRVSELESQEFTLPHDPFRDADRDLRERLVCAALNGILSEQRGLLNHEYALRAIGLADATLDAMRKGDECNR